MTFTRDFQAALTATVKEYVDKGEYTNNWVVYSTGKGRASDYQSRICDKKKEFEEKAKKEFPEQKKSAANAEKKDANAAEASPDTARLAQINKYVNQSLEEMALNDFMATGSDAVLGTSAKLRRRVGILVCEKYGLTSQVETEVGKRAYPNPMKDAEVVELMQTLLREKLAEQYENAYLARLKNMLDAKEAKMDSVTSLRAALNKADPKYAKLKEVHKQFGDLLKAVLNDLNNKARTIHNRQMIIDEVIVDFEQRVMTAYKNKVVALGAGADSHLKTILEKVIQPTTFHVLNNLQTSGFVVADLIEDLLKFPGLAPELQVIQHNDCMMRMRKMLDGKEVKLDCLGSIRATLVQADPDYAKKMESHEDADSLQAAIVSDLKNKTCVIKNRKLIIDCMVLDFEHRIAQACRTQWAALNKKERDAQLSLVVKNVIGPVAWPLLDDAPLAELDSGFNLGALIKALLQYPALKEIFDASAKKESAEPAQPASLGQRR